MFSAIFVLRSIYPVRMFAILAVLLGLTLAQSTSIAENEGHGYPAQINVEIEDGYHLYESAIVSGTFQDEVAPLTFTWSLLDSTGERHFVDLSDDLVIESDDGEWKTWSFDVEIKPLEIGSCACTIVLTANNEVESQSLYVPIFINPNSHQLPPTLHIFEEQGESWASHVIEVNALSMTTHDYVPMFEYMLRESPNIKCNNIVETANQGIVGMPDDLVILNSSDVLFDVDSSGKHEGKITFQLDMGLYADGWYDLVLFSIDPWNQEFAYDCISLRVDNIAPMAIIEGPRNITESDEGVTIDGASSFDETWGIQGLTYIWTVTDSIGISDFEMFFAAGTDHRSITIIPEVSGTYEVKLTVIDQAGNIGQASMNVVIHNSAPIVRLSIDGELVQNNHDFTLKRDSTCILDATGSTDTTNDAENLRYIWRVNNIPTYEGSYRILSWPEGVEDDFILTIEVIDDDMESTQMSILVKDVSEDSALPIPILILVISTIFLTYAIVNSRNQDTDSDIPKWT